MVDIAFFLHDNNHVNGIFFTLSGFPFLYTVLLKQFPVYHCHYVIYEV